MITLWDFNDCTRIQSKNHLMKYVIIGKEICPYTQKLHFHAYIEFKKDYSISSVKSIIKSKEIHCEIARLNREACSSYCIKEECFFQYEEPTSEASSEDIFDVFGIKLKH
jgi:hypothetical protein